MLKLELHMSIIMNPDEYDDYLDKVKLGEIMANGSLPVDTETILPYNFGRRSALVKDVESKDSSLDNSHTLQIDMDITPGERSPKVRYKKPRLTIGVIKHSHYSLSTKVCEDMNHNLSAYHFYELVFVDYGNNMTSAMQSDMLAFETKYLNSLDKSDRVLIMQNIPNLLKPVIFY